MLHPRVATLAEETEPLFPAELRKLRFQRQQSVLKGGWNMLEHGEAMAGSEFGKASNFDQSWAS